MSPLLTCLCFLTFICDGAVINWHPPDVNGITVQTETNEKLLVKATSPPKNVDEFLLDKITPDKAPPDKTDPDGALYKTSWNELLLGETNSHKVLLHQKNLDETFLDKANQVEAVFKKTDEDERFYGIENLQNLSSDTTNNDAALYDETTPDETCYDVKVSNEELSSAPNFDKTHPGDTNLDEAVFDKTNPNDAVSDKTYHGQINREESSDVRGLEKVLSNEVDLNETFTNVTKSDEMLLNTMNMSETKLTTRAIKTKEGAARVKASFERAITFTQNAAQKQNIENVARQLAAKSRQTLDQFAKQPEPARIKASIDRAVTFTQNATQRQNIENAARQLKEKGRKTLDRIVKQDPAIRTFIKCVSTVKSLKLRKPRRRNSKDSSETASIVFDDLSNSGSSSGSLSSSPERRRRYKERQPPGSPELGIVSASPPPSPTNRYGSPNKRQASPEKARSNNNSPKTPKFDGEFTDKRGTRRRRNEWPIVYREEYNINVLGFESYIKDYLKLFDPRKLENVFFYLKQENMLSETSISIPEKADREELLVAHSTDYLDNLQYKSTLAQITGVWILNLFPYSTLETHLLEPIRHQAGGSILAGELAIHRGWAINVGGGFNQASASQGKGFCAYADISLLIKWLFEFYPDRVKSAMIVDLSASQGRGHETDFSTDERVFIVDIYNKLSRDQDDIAKRAIDSGLELEAKKISSEEYLEIVETYLENSLSEPLPDILVYNAGTDIITGDPSGLGISAEAIIKRDEIVFTKAKYRRIPIAMVTGAGFLYDCSSVVARTESNGKFEDYISFAKLDNTLHIGLCTILLCEQTNEHDPHDVASPVGSFYFGFRLNEFSLQHIVISRNGLIFNILYILVKMQYLVNVLLEKKLISDGETLDLHLLNLRKNTALEETDATLHYEMDSNRVITFKVTPDYILSDVPNLHDAPFDETDPGNALLYQADPNSASLFQTYLFGKSSAKNGSDGVVLAETNFDKESLMGKYSAGAHFNEVTSYKDSLDVTNPSKVDVDAPNSCEALADESHSHETFFDKINSDEADRNKYHFNDKQLHGINKKTLSDATRLDNDISNKIDHEESFPNQMVVIDGSSDKTKKQRQLSDTISLNGPNLIKRELTHISQLTKRRRTALTTFLTCLPRARLLKRMRIKSQRSSSITKRTISPIGKQILSEKISFSRTPKVLDGNGDFTDKKGIKRTTDEWPIVYSNEYNIDVSEYETLVQEKEFDPEPWRKIIELLTYEKMLTEGPISVPLEADLETLLLVHGPEYLNSLKDSKTIAKITEMSRLSMVKNTILNQSLLKSLRFQVGGSILAGELAIHRGWAVNIGGGFNHASSDRGESFCVYADITLLIKWLFKYYPDRVTSAMIIDLNPCQGTGYERDFLNDKRIFIMDVYNKKSHRQDNRAINAINCEVKFHSHKIPGDDYIELVKRNLENSLQEFHPDILVYVAGSDMLTGHRSANLKIANTDIIRRDEIVFTKAIDLGIPIVMLTGAGYLDHKAPVMARSILNLKKLEIIKK